MRERAPLHGHVRHAARRGHGVAWGHQDEGQIRPQRERLQHGGFVALEALRRLLARRAVDAHIGDVREPPRALIGEIGIAQKLAALQKARPQIADRPLDFPLRLRAVRLARPNAKAPVRGETPELGIFQQPTAIGPLILDDVGIELIKQNLTRHATEVGEGALKALHHGQCRLARYELHVQHPRVPQDHEHRVALAPRQFDVGEIKLRL